MTVLKENDFAVKYVWLNIAAKVIGQRIYSVLQKKAKKHLPAVCSLKAIHGTTCSILCI